MIKTLKQWLKFHRRITAYASRNKSNREYWKGYKKGWIACMDNLLMEAEDNQKLSNPVSEDYWDSEDSETSGSTKEESK